jgi:hypothetical protein
MSHGIAVANSIGSTIEAASFSGLLIRSEIGHIRIGSMLSKKGLRNGLNDDSC